MAGGGPVSDSSKILHGDSNNTDLHVYEVVTDSKNNGKAAHYLQNMFTK